MADWITPLIQLGGSIYDTYQQSETSKENVKKTILANKELAEYAYAKDLEMWHRANEYNLPEQQMERIRNAGLNPNLVYGSGGATTLGATLPKYQAPRVDYTAIQPIQPGSAIASALATFNDFRIKSAQVDLLKEQTKYNQINQLYLQRKSIGELERSDISRSRAVMLSKQAGMIDKMLDYQLQALEFKNKKVLQETENLRKKGVLSDLDIDWYQYKRLAPALLGVGSNVLKGLFRNRAISGQGVKSVMRQKYGPFNTPGMKSYVPVW